jgi:hypothetical protein
MKKEITPHIENRILRFFNTVEKPFEIVQKILDDPGDTETERFRTKLAKRILAVRETLPEKRFKTLAQIDAISGVGPDKLDDLIYTFGLPASEVFASALFDRKILLENWTVLRYEWVSETEADHRQLVENPEAFRQIVYRLAVRAAMETAGYDEAEAQNLCASILTDYMDVYTNSTAEAAYAFALWFYRFDADNWFSFDKMFDETAAFFDYNSEPYTGAELRLFKGFDNRVFWALIARSDLPVTVDHAERAITLWVVGLAD